MQRSDVSSLDDLRAFGMVARLGSVRAAAGALALTHGAVSRRVSKLSRELGVALLAPAGRGVALTPEGEVLARAVAEAMATLGKAVETIRAARAATPIVLSCERSLAMRWLIPRLGVFQERFPEVDLHLSVGGGALDFARERVGVAVRRLDFPLDPSWTVRTLFAERVGPVMQPRLTDRMGAGLYTALGSRTRPEAWDAWLQRHPKVRKPQSVRLFDHHFLMLEAAASGLGVALCPRVLAIDEVDRGRLAAPFGFVEDGSVYAVIHPAGPPAGPVTRLIDWLIETGAGC